VPGHTYYYNAATKKSTYTRPAVPLPIFEPLQTTTAFTVPVLNPSQSFLQYQAVENPAPNTGATFHDRDHHTGRGGHQIQRGGRQGNEQQRDRRPQPTDKPKSKYEIPGCEPWILVNTKLGRRFVYNPDKGQSYWRIPDKLKDGILALDQLRIKEKAEALVEQQKPVDSQQAPGAAGMPGQAERAQEPIQNSIGD